MTSGTDSGSSATALVQSQVVVSDQDSDGSTVERTSISQHQHSCYCGKSFIRKEHLRRHQATHRERAYVCNICQRSFTRNDLLRRHAARHGAEAANGGRKSRACDACHANKSRCTGGPVCSLCEKRGTRCTFKSNLASQSERLASVVESTGAFEATKAVETVERPTSSPTMPALVSSEPSTMVTSQKQPTILQQLPSGMIDFLSNLSVRLPAGDRVNRNRSQPGSLTQTGFMIEPTRGIKALYKIISSPTASATLEGDFAVCAGLKAWAASCCETYFEHFHHRWPLLHAPTFDEDLSPRDIVASVIMIGSWLQGPHESRQTVLLMHELLVDRFFGEMTKKGFTARGREWPMEFYQAVLLNVIFGVFCGREEHIARAALLCNLVISVSREVGVFDQDAMVYQRKTYTPGSFLPYIMTTEQRCKRYVAGLFAMDSYLSIIRGQPPNIQPEELDICVPCTFSLWNAHPIPRLFERTSEEIADRALYKMSTVAGPSLPVVGPVPLVEDIHLRLCGMQQSIWRHAEYDKDGTNSIYNAEAERESIMLQLDHSVFQLDELSGLFVTQGAKGEITSFPLRAYRGGENSADQVRWKLSPLDLALTWVYECTILYHLSVLRLYADSSMLSQETASTTPWRSAVKPTDEESARLVREWAHSKRGRRALSHGLALLKTQESSSTKYSYPAGTTNPVERMAVSISVKVIRAWILATGQDCICDSTISLVDSSLGPAALIRDSVLQYWIETGGPLAVNGVAICRCRFADWVSLWDARLASVENAPVS